MLYTPRRTAIDNPDVDKLRAGILLGVRAVRKTSEPPEPAVLQALLKRAVDKYTPIDNEKSLGYTLGRHWAIDMFRRAEAALRIEAARSEHRQASDVLETEIASLRVGYLNAGTEFLKIAQTLIHEAIQNYPTVQRPGRTPDGVRKHLYALWLLRLSSVKEPEERARLVGVSPVYLDELGIRSRSLLPEELPPDLKKFLLRNVPVTLTAQKKFFLTSFTRTTRPSTPLFGVQDRTRSGRLLIGAIGRDIEQNLMSTSAFRLLSTPIPDPVRAYVAVRAPREVRRLSLAYETLLRHIVASPGIRTKSIPLSEDVLRRGIEVLRFSGYIEPFQKGRAGFWPTERGRRAVV